MQLFIGGKLTSEPPPEAQQWLDILPPPSSIGYWLLGGADPGYSVREVIAIDYAGVSRLYQHDWEVIFEKRDEEGRPVRIRLRAADGPLPGAEAVVEIARWLPAS